MLGVLGLLVGAIAIAGLAYLVGRITIKWLKQWKTRKQNKVVAVEAQSLIKEIAKSPDIAHVSLDDLEDLDDDDVILAEYDPDDDEIISTGYADEAGDIDRVLNSNNGIVILD